MTLKVCLDLEQLKEKNKKISFHCLVWEILKGKKVEKKNARKTYIVMKKNFFQILEKNEEKIYSWSLVKNNKLINIIFYSFFLYWYV